MTVFIKKRSMPVQVLLAIVTLGIYCIYWFYQVAVELKNIGDDQQASPGLWTVLIFVPFGMIYSHYKFSELYEKVSTGHFDKWLLFVLWWVFAPAVWYIIQSDLNKRADTLATNQVS